jgi:hypothetical protein
MASPPVDYNISANDMSNAGSTPGATTFAPPASFMNAPQPVLSTTAPSGAGALTGQVSGNRGIFFLPGGFNGFPVASLSITASSMSGYVWYNLSPYYCQIGAANSSATITNTTIAGAIFTGFVSSFTLPPFGSFAYTFSGMSGSVSVIETCDG